MRVIVGLVGALAVAGCATSDLSRSRGKFGQALALSDQARAVLQSPNESLPPNAPIDAVMIYQAQRASASDDAAREKAVAEATARALIMKSDLLCDQYMASMLKQARTAKSTLSLSGLALSTAGGVATPASSANLLSSLSSFAKGADAGVSAIFFADQTPEVVYKAMMVRRTEVRTRLLKLLELDGGAPHVVLGSLGEYHTLCNPTVGINSLEDAVKEQAEKAVEKGADQAAAFVGNKAVTPAKPDSK